MRARTASCGARSRFRKRLLREASEIAGMNDARMRIRIRYHCTIGLFELESRRKARSSAAP